MPFTAALRQRILEPLWSRYTGAKLLDAWQELERSQWLPREVLALRQWRLLHDLLRFAYDQNPFYRARFTEAGINPEAMRGPDAFRQLPVLTKAEVRFHGTKLLSRGVDPARLMTAKTGGSTGKPIELLFTEEVSQLRNASGRRNQRWAGWEVGEPVGAVWGNPIYPDTIRGHLREWLLSPTIYLDTMSVTPEAVSAFAREWMRARPTLLFGHAHSLFVLASTIEEAGIAGVAPKAIIATSMMLLPHERLLIERVFGVKVTDMYGCEEVGLIASECERHEGLHLNVDQVFVEILREDGTPAGPGEAGSVIVTDLLNRAMPFIRYRMEDMAELAGHPCSCGRGLPMLRRVVGRTADFLKRRDGSRVAGISLIENTLTRIPGLHQMQIVQEELLHIVLRIVPADEFTAARRAELVGYFETTFPGARIQLEDVAAIPQEPNGKYRFSICRVAD
jgi:phenylacetate-coenzyme A ligase PaaK-like adenylate-forming protein